MTLGLEDGTNPCCDDSILFSYDLMYDPSFDIGHGLLCGICAGRNCMISSGVKDDSFNRVIIISIECTSSELGGIFSVTMAP